MKMLNKTELPQFIVDVANELYNSHRTQEKFEFSITELLKGTKELLLLRRHSNEIEVDAQDSVSLWTGTAVHAMVQKYAESQGLICEKEVSTTYQINNRYITVSGRFDFYDTKTKTLYDLKDCKVAGFQKAQRGEDTKWLKQLLSYARELREEGYEVERIVIIAIITDHSKVKANTDSTYPQGAISLITWDLDEQLKEIQEQYHQETKKKLEEIMDYFDAPDDAIPPCTPEERFEDPKYAVMKKGRKTAIKLFDSEDEATLLAQQDKDYYVEFRKGNPIKCKLYCSACKFCNFYKENCEVYDD